MQNIPFHPIADIFPLIHGKEFVDLKADISANGVYEPVVLFDGQILDGRNRFRACQETGVAPEFIEYEGDDPVSYVLSLNLHRRHLSESQRAMVGAKIANLDKHSFKGNQSVTANLQEATTRAEAAEMLNVSERTVNTAKKVQREGTPELVEAVEQGSVSVSAAAGVSGLPDDEQIEIVDEIEQGAKPSEVIKKHILATKHTGDEESYTPPEYIDSARLVMGEINLDPASNYMAQETVNADTYYTVDDDGLDKEWAGRVWMNPPYTARVINRFIEKITDHYNAGDIEEAIVLTNNNTDTSWFHLGARSASAICFTAGRINFLKRDGSKSSPTNGQCFFYFGNNIDKFKIEFSQHGMVMVKA